MNTALDLDAEPQGLLLMEEERRRLSFLIGERQMEQHAHESVFAEVGVPKLLVWPGVWPGLGDGVTETVASGDEGMESSLCSGTWQKSSGEPRRARWFVSRTIACNA